MVSHLCLFSIHGLYDDHKWPPADMQAAAGLQVIIHMRAVPRAWATHCIDAARRSLFFSFPLLLCMLSHC